MAVASISGLPVVMLSPIAFLTRPERWLWALHHYRGTFVAAPNFAYELAARKVADADIAGLDLSALRAALNGAEPVNPATLDRFASRFGPYGLRREVLMPVYGLAESSVGVCIPPLGRNPRIDHVERETFACEGRAISANRAQDDGTNGSQLNDLSIVPFVSVGAPLPDHEVCIVDTEGPRTRGPD